MTEQLSLDRETFELPSLLTERGPSLRNATLDWLFARSSPISRSTYAGALRRFVSWWEGQGLTLEDLDDREPAAASIDAYLQSLAVGERPLADTSIRVHLTALRTWIDHLIRADFLHVNAARDAAGPRLPPLEDRRHVPALGVDGAAALLRSIERSRPIDWRDHAMILVMFYTGIRVSPLVALKVSDLEIRDEGAVLIERGKRGKLTEHPLVQRPLEDVLRYLAVREGDEDLAAQGSLERLLDGLQIPLERMRAAGLALFCSSGGGRGGGLAERPLVRHNVNSMLARRCKAAGLPKISPHSLRAGFGKELRRRGADMGEVQAAMGHQNISTTRIYVPKDDEEDARRALAERIRL